MNLNKRNRTVLDGAADDPADAAADAAPADEKLLRCHCEPRGFLLRICGMSRCAARVQQPSENRHLLGASRGSRNRHDAARSRH
eukprot:10824963-Alexandrium_andersonii.AAC.1